jgi:ribonuclease HI
MSAPNSQEGSEPEERAFYRLNTDGGIVAKRGQSAGEAAIGVVLKEPDGGILHRVSVRIGWVKDHHVAEYRALIVGLRLARGHAIDDLRVLADSALVVNQINGDSKVNAEHLKPLWQQTVDLVKEFNDIEIRWVPRKENAEADVLASEALREHRAREATREG